MGPSHDSWVRLKLNDKKYFLHPTFGQFNQDSAGKIVAGDLKTENKLGLRVNEATEYPEAFLARLSNIKVDEGEEGQQAYAQVYQALISDYPSKKAKINNESITSVLKAAIIEDAYSRFSERNKKLDRNALSEFIKNHVDIIEVGGTRIVLIDQEHRSFNNVVGLNPYLKYFVCDRQTKRLVLEYFNPDIQSGAEYTPIIGEAISKRWNSGQTGYSGTPNMEFFDELAIVASRAGKPITTVDIANRPIYEIYWWLIRYLPAFASLGNLPAAVLDKLNLTLPLTGALSANFFLNLSGISTDDEKIHTLEKLVFDVEDARRYCAASAIRDLAKDIESQYPPSAQCPREKPQIVVVYPKAHAIFLSNQISHYYELVISGTLIG